ncbi:hypothetical protein GW17_00041527 [Ensete ventricosum]|nr:hypothetical protein GW17_00041527 [Ensete ventricosum]
MPCDCRSHHRFHWIVASPCVVISHHGIMGPVVTIILFSKGCPNPSFPLCATAAAAAPAQAVAALARWQPPYQGAATPAAGTSTGAALAGAAPTSGRPCRQQPLRVVPLPTGCLLVGVEPVVGHLQAVGNSPCGVVAGGCCPLWAPRCSRPPSSGCSCGLATGGRYHLRAGLGRRRLPLAAGLPVGGRPYIGAGRGWPPLLLDAFAAKTKE